MKLVCGVEEAGRGPVIGPMVMCGVVVKDSDQIKLKQLGIKDSKLLTPKRREELFDIVKENVESFKIVILNADDVDNSLNDPSLNLNKLEGITSAKIINSLNCEKAILDCPSNNIPAYAGFVKGHVKNQEIEILAEHKADLNHPVVSAASILAKVTRDRLIQDLKKEAKKLVNDENIGSGYPADPFTKKFLLKYWDKLDSVKGGFFRKTWATWKKVAKGKAQTGLSSFK